MHGHLNDKLIHESTTNIVRRTHKLYAVFTTSKLTDAALRAL